MIKLTFYFLTGVFGVSIQGCTGNDAAIEASMGVPVLQSIPQRSFSCNTTLLPDLFFQGGDAQKSNQQLSLAARCFSYAYVKDTLSPPLNPCGVQWIQALEDCEHRNDGYYADRLLQSCRSCYSEKTLQSLLYAATEKKHYHFSKVIIKHLEDF